MSGKISDQDLAFYKRCMAAPLGTCGLKPNDPELLSYSYPSERARNIALASDTMHTALVAYERGELKIVLRSLMLAREYIGRIGSFPFAVMHDAAIALQHVIEDRLS